MRIPLASHSYQARSKPLSAQRLVNLYPEPQPSDAKSPLVLYGTPGLKLFGTAGAGPTRGIHDMANVLYVISGDTLYSVDSVGTGTSLGTIPGTGTVSMADNGSQLIIINSLNDGYVWNGSTLVQITDVDWPGAGSVAYLDGYGIFTNPNQTGQWFISAISDFTNYDALDYASAEGDPDDAVRVFVDHREVWIFGERSTEVWYNSGAADFPFERISGAVLERGCAAKASVAKLDNTVFWLGNDLIVYRADGYTPTVISSPAIAYAIGNYADPSTARAFSYTQENHMFYVLTFDEATWVYDASTNRWHERQSYGLTRHHMEHHAYVYSKNIVGDYEAGNLYELDLDTYQDNGGVIQRIATSPPIMGDRDGLIMALFALDIESGAGLTTGQGSDPQAMLRWSDDGGKTWSNEAWESMGKIGDFKHKPLWRRLGQFDERVMEVTISDPIKVAIMAAEVEIV